jgi:hypothetical protein
MMKFILLSIVLEWLALNCPDSAFGTRHAELLASPRFKVRQNAARALERAWPASDAILRNTALSKDPEASDAAAKILARCRQRALDQAGPAPWADWPLMQADGSGWDGARFPWLYERIKRDMPPFQNDAPLYHQYQQISEQWAREALDAGVPPSVIRIWFAAGRAVDAKYKARSTGPEWNKMP